MSANTVTIDGAASFDTRGFALADGARFVRVVTSALVGGLINGIGAVIFVAVLAAVATVSAALIVRTGLVSTGHVYSTTLTGPGTLATSYDPDAIPAPAASQQAVTTAAEFYARYVVKVPQSRVAAKVRRTPLPVQIARLEPAATPKDIGAVPPPVVTAKVDRVPLPHMRPSLPVPEPVAPQPEIARAPVPEAAPAPKLAAIAPTPPPVAVEKRAVPQEAHNRSAMDPDTGARTAVYDIAAHTVYLPNGERLEAHSGLYDKIDDPRYIKVRMRGPTPPNVYDLSLREQLFHGVRAIRLNPLDEGKMHGRDGMLAHTYMLGPTGQSNGCVSFKDYKRFLQAFLDGKVDRMVVVPNLGNKSWRTAAQEGGTRSGAARRYASRYSRDSGDDEPSFTGALGYAARERGAGTW